MCSCFAGLLGDLYQFDDSKLVWVNLTNLTQGIAPDAREGHGFTYGPNGNLYVYGGKSKEGENSQADFSPAVAVEY